MTNCPCCGQPFPEMSKPAVCLDTNTVTYGKHQISLPPSLAELLSELVRVYPRILSHDMIDDAIWGAADLPKNSVVCVRVHIHFLRRRLQPIGLDIDNVWGTGYRLLIGERRRSAA